MFEWNVVATAHADGYFDALKELRRFGEVKRSDYFNVLVMKVPDPESFLAALAEAIEKQPGLLNFISHVTPARQAFSFRDAADFETRARDIVLQWIEELKGRRFHVRMHRRGFKGRLSTPDEERFLDEALLEALAAAGAPGEIRFDDADAVIAVDTVDNRAGLSLWTREQLERHPFLGFE